MNKKQKVHALFCLVLLVFLSTSTSLQKSFSHKLTPNLILENSSNKNNQKTHTLQLGDGKALLGYIAALNNEIGQYLIGANSGMGHFSSIRTTTSIAYLAKSYNSLEKTENAVPHPLVLKAQGLHRRSQALLGSPQLENENTEIDPQDSSQNKLTALTTIREEIGVLGLEITDSLYSIKAHTTKNIGERYSNFHVSQKSA